MAACVKRGALAPFPCTSLFGFTDVLITCSFGRNIVCEVINHFVHFPQLEAAGDACSWTVPSLFEVWRQKDRFSSVPQPEEPGKVPWARTRLLPEEL